MFESVCFPPRELRQKYALTFIPAGNECSIKGNNCSNCQKLFYRELNEQLLPFSCNMVAIPVLYAFGRGGSRSIG